MVKKVVTKIVTQTAHETPNVKRDMKKPEVFVSDEKKMTAREREEMLIENFVGLQHAMTNLSIKFSTLSDNISRLLRVYEESARNLLQGGKLDNNEMLKKVDSLLEQNKTIAKGLVLMEDKLREAPKVPENHPQVPQPPRFQPINPPPVPQPPTQRPPAPGQPPQSFIPKPLPSI